MRPDQRSVKINSDATAEYRGHVELEMDRMAIVRELKTGAPNLSHCYERPEARQRGNFQYLARIPDRLISLMQECSVTS